MTSSRARLGARSTRPRAIENSRFSVETRSRSYAKLVLIWSTFFLDCRQCCRTTSAPRQGNLGWAGHLFFAVPLATRTGNGVSTAFSRGAGRFFRLWGWRGRPLPSTGQMTLFQGSEGTRIGQATTLAWPAANPSTKRSSRRPQNGVRGKSSTAGFRKSPTDRRWRGCTAVRSFA
jgi:hypothetical protein